MGNLHYTIIPFQLKNVGGTNQHVINAIFQDVLHDYLEDYLDDLVVNPL